MRFCERFAIVMAMLAASLHPSAAFTRSTTRQRPMQLAVSPTEAQYQSHQLDRDEVHPILRLGSGDKQKIVNGFGLWCAVVSLLTCPLWAVAMSAVNALSKLNDSWDPHRAVYDKTGKLWARTWLTMTDSFPSFSGDVGRLKEGQGACLYVANHASWLDIPVLCTVLDPVFKFIAKGELRKVPCIGQQLEGGNHILIDREDRRSQLRTFKDGITWLKKGVPIMAFPEGMRSKDGRLMHFKGGLFSMAAKTQVPIVPITIAHAHAVMPGYSLFPVQPGAGKLHVHVHEAIDTAGKSEEELAALVKQSFLSTLPFDQHPLPNQQEIVEAVASHHAPKIETVNSPHFFMTEIVGGRAEKVLERVR